MNANSLDLVIHRLRRARGHGSLREAWRVAVYLTVREESDARWWIHRAALAHGIGRDEDARSSARQALFLLRRGGCSRRAMALCMWLRRNEIELDEGLRRAS